MNLSKETEMTQEINFNEKTNELSVFEQVNKELVLSKDGFKVPISYVFGRGVTANTQSFGALTFAENAARTDLALQNVSELQNIWNHSHSQWAWKHLNLSYHAPYRNMRQIAAEITRKKSALNEAKWGQVEAELKVRKIEEQLMSSTTLDHWEEVKLKIKLTKLKEGIAEGVTHIEGAMKDVLTLNELFEQLKARVSNFSEADIEKEETKSHLKRALVQSIRDVRMSGSISKAEQEYIEQIGINPMKIQNLLRAYVQKEAEEESWDVRGLYAFVDELTDELVDKCQVDKVRMALQGFSSDYNENFGYSEKLALLNHEPEKSNET